MIFSKFFNKDEQLVSSIAQKFGLSERIAQLILSRGVNSESEVEEFLNPVTFHDPFLLRGMKDLCDRVKLAKALNDKVLIFGDYDVDGVSATAIMIKTLAKMGINANYYLPNRYVDGYGLTNAVIDKIYDLYQPNLIITVDCGISCFQEVEYAKSKGIEIIVTDHHEIPDVLPDTIVCNAKIKGQDYPYSELCGTGMAFKIAQALLGFNVAREFLPIAAIATIADIVPLNGENRTIVTQGLKLMDKYLPKGLKMLFREFGLSIQNASSTDISFKIAPKINASGRMGDAQDSLRLYLENDPVKIKKYIDLIIKHNTKRQEICAKIYEDCEKALGKVDLKQMRVICLASKVWDQGVLGIVCSRLVEKYHRPVFLFSQEGDLLKGSGRSIDELNIHTLLSSLKNILETFGGHSMAAGLTLKKDKYQEFIQKVNAFAFEHISDKAFIPIRYYDQDITLQEITPEFVRSLDILQPFGCENPVPRFKITTQEIELKPLRRFPQHANIKIGDLELMYFNFLDNYNKIMFSRTKSFIFTFKDRSMKGVVEDFDGGSFIVEDAYKKLNPIEIEQLSCVCQDAALYNLYPNKELTSFVGGTTTSVFGTCFVTFSCFDYIDFCKNYNTQGIYNFGIYDRACEGFNSLLLSPHGVDWAKNFNKIVFLSPCLDNKYLAKIKAVSGAEIFVPMEKKINYHAYANIDLSRATFGKIYTALANKKGLYYNIFELFDNLKLGQISFATFMSAFCVFRQLELIKVEEKDMISINVNKKDKKELTQSSIYNSLLDLKSLGGNYGAGSFD